MRNRFVSLGIAGLLMASLVVAGGCSGGGSATSGAGGANTAVAPESQGFGAHGSVTTASDSSAKSASSDRLVIETASMEMQVSDLAAAIDSIRKLTESLGGTVSDLTVESDSESAAPAAPHSASETVSIPGPASAELTLRIPAEKLAEAESRTGAFGTVTSQSSKESDVTQKHIDLSARLANSQAEEARLRALLNRAGTVSDLLQVERELTRVQGDIESMQAQLAYLDSQIEMATLTVSLDQPGPVVRPWVGGWGFSDAVTEGVQGAAGLLRGLISAVLTLSPLIVIAGLVWWLIAWIFRRRRARRAARQSAQTQAASAAAAQSAEQPPADR